ncbi:unnamed protein product [Spirodela intermedia]|uniref:Uncharacterized protein n=1 Tax=Spirodela intermedia TaxID=51605 RepID=A0A7I8IAK6_SPIIN|nr:unnamed protein product [Spirodela intermedia]CAA6654620.1 unnamed protein product [Spirodela intermedia]
MYLKLGSVPTVVVSNADMAEEIHKSHDSVFCSRPIRAVTNRLSYGGHGVTFASYGEGWRQLRKISVAELYTTKRIQYLRAIREEEVRVLIKTIAEISAADQMPNVSDMARCLLNNIICRQAFGRRCSNDGECRRNKFHDQLWESSKLLGAFCPSDFFPSMGFLDRLTGFHGHLEKAFNFFDNLLEEEIEDHLKCDNEDDRDFMGVLLRLQKDTSLGFSLTENKSRLSSWYANTNSLRRLRLLILCLVLQEIFLGGSDSTASVIEFGMLELALNPRVMNKAQEESDLQKLTYLKLVVKEILRHRPPGPIPSPHESMKDVNVRGYDIPAKTRVITNIWAIMRDPQFWKDPEVFWPERFEDNDLQYKGQDFQYIPFSTGRRICPGMNLAVTGVELTLANLLHCFNWELPDGMKPEDVDLSETVRFLFQLKTPLQLKATPAF